MNESGDLRLTIRELRVRHRGDAGVVPHDLERQIAAAVSNALSTADGPGADLSISDLRVQISLRSADPRRWQKVVAQVSEQVVESIRSPATPHLQGSPTTTITPPPSAGSS